MEYHILIAWNKANITTSQIIEELPKNIILVNIFEYTWDSRYANQNFAAFYGEKLENIQYKVDHCGSGPFRIFLLKDMNPLYDMRFTSSGKRLVNANMFDLKANLRAMTGGGHLIHASDSCDEADLNCMALFGKLATEVANTKYDTVTINGINYIQLRRNISGASGWKNWEEFFSVLNKVTDYVVLRNVETVTDNSHDIHGDTDLLVGDFVKAITVVAAQKVFPGKQRVLYSVIIAGDKQLIDFRHVSDDYYCEKWEKDILKNRVKYKDTDIYIPDNNNYKYSILYHALVHKPFISPDYLAIFQTLFGDNSRGFLKKELNTFMKQKQYSYTLPKDSSVFIHTDYFDVINVSAFTCIINNLKILKCRYMGNGRENQCSQKIYQVLYSGYYLAIAKLRKLKTGFKRFMHK